MAGRKGIIALMGSGELTATMVEVHKQLLASLAVPPKVAFLDTPAGFQLNVDFLSERAADYFRQRIQHPLRVASFKSREGTSPFEAEEAYQVLREAGYILIGPGSPTYAVRQWRETPIASILIQRIEAGGCLVAASAAALTVGSCTLPVYEIYKVGQELYWEQGLDILSHFGFDLVVVPHWNNAEGGTHDTRFCYMGEPRFRKLEQLLSNSASVLGLDEHTACLLDLNKNEALVQGIGKITLRRGQDEITFAKGDRFSLDLLREKGTRVTGHISPLSSDVRGEGKQALPGEDPFWGKVHEVEEAFQKGLAEQDYKASTNALLELDRLVWEAQQDLENPEFISQARELLREFIVFLGLKLESAPLNQLQCLSPLVDALLSLREGFREQEMWEAADAIRAALHQAGVIVEDGKRGSSWHLEEKED
jgi:peptidase E